MKALIMAAGVGSRISRHLDGQPKCCVKVDGKELIRHTVELLLAKGIGEIAIVTGYQRQFIFNALSGLEYKNYNNPFYDVTNSIASAWFARDFLNPYDDYLIMNGDVFIEERVIDLITEVNGTPMFLADSSRIQGADYRFTWKNNKLEKFGKELSDAETSGEYVGIAQIPSNSLEFMHKRLCELIDMQKHHFWWEDVFYQSLDKMDVNIKDIKGCFWAEVDYIEDYMRIAEYVNHKELSNG